MLVSVKVIHIISSFCFSYGNIDPYYRISNLCTSVCSLTLNLRVPVYLGTIWMSVWTCICYKNYFTIFSILSVYWWNSDLLHVGFSEAVNMVACCQHCRQHKCVGCLTGFLGCRCRGYEQSSGNTTLVCTFAASLCYDLLPLLLLLLNSNFVLPSYFLVFTMG